jgi:phage terminase large subunit-like protein
LAFSAEDPEQLRGPQFDAAWCDELAKWRHADATFDMLQFGLRLGARPRQLITTTPRPISLIKRLVADPRAAVTRAATHANAVHLSPAVLNEVLARYAGTRLGRQEIDGEIIEERTDALWT